MKFRTMDEGCAERKMKVLFASHPDDFEKYFNAVSEKILTLQDCAVFYEKDCDILPEDLQEMNLIVTPVTRNFMEKPCAAREIFLTAEKAGIPVLPLLAEKGLASGLDTAGRRYLDLTDDDPGSVPAEERLGEFLSVVLADPEKTEKAGSAFETQFFLSCGKNDRKFAWPVMRAIRKTEEAGEPAIWHASHLLPPEDTADCRKEELLKSDLFLLLVTSDLAKNGDSAAEEEYQIAVEAGKKILPIAMEKVSERQLQKRFPQLPACIPWKEDEFPESLPCGKKPEWDAKKLYLAGVAYLYGIGTEIDRSRGADLLKEADAAGCREATALLSMMNYYGFAVPENLEEAIRLQRKQIMKLSLASKKRVSVEQLFELEAGLRTWVKMENETPSWFTKTQWMLKTCRQMLSLCSYVRTLGGKGREGYICHTLRDRKMLGRVYELCGQEDDASVTYREAISIGRELEEQLEKGEVRQDQPENLHFMAQFHYYLAFLFQKKGENRKAADELEKVLTMYEIIAKTDRAYLAGTAIVHGDLSAVLLPLDAEAAERHSKCALDICRSLAEENPYRYELNYADALLSQAAVLTRPDTAEKILQQARGIYEKYMEDAAYQTVFGYMNALYGLAGIYRQTDQREKAEEAYAGAVKTAAQYENIAQREEKLTMARMYLDFGKFLTDSGEEKKISAGEDCLKKALSLFEITGKAAKREMVETKELLWKLGALPTGKEQQVKQAANETVLSRAYEKYQRFITEASNAEQKEDYENAYSAYESAEQQLSVLEGKHPDINPLDRAKLFYKKAYCSERSRNFSVAESFYVKAVDLAVAQAKETGSIDAVSAASTFLKELLDFSENNTSGESVITYWRKLEGFKMYLLGKEPPRKGQWKDGRGQ